MRPFPAASLMRYHDDVQQFRRITMDPGVMGGAPCIRGMRVTVGMIVEAVSAYATVGEISDAMRRVFGEYREAVVI